MIITMACSRLVMINWGHQVKQRLMRSGITVLLESCYVDDGRHLLSLIGKGMRYDRRTKSIHNNTEGQAGLDNKKRKQDTWMISNKRRKIGRHSDEQSETQNLDKLELPDYLNYLYLYLYLFIFII